MSWDGAIVVNFSYLDVVNNNSNNDTVPLNNCASYSAGDDELVNCDELAQSSPVSGGGTTTLTVLIGFFLLLGIRLLRLKR